jgi:hypothetical protein
VIELQKLDVLSINIVTVALVFMSINIQGSTNVSYMVIVVQRIQIPAARLNPVNVFVLGQSLILILLLNVKIGTLVVVIVCRFIVVKSRWSTCSVNTLEI